MRRDKFCKRKLLIDKINIFSVAFVVICLFPFQTVQAQFFDANNEEQPVPFAVVDEKPMFNGMVADLGYKTHVEKHYIYPVEALQAGISGRVFVEFIIERDGSISGVKAINNAGVDSLLIWEALRIAYKTPPNWTAGKLDGEEVRVQFVYPFVFEAKEDIKPTLDVKPLFNGLPGDIGFRHYVNANVRYPSKAQRKNIAGRVILEFVVEKDGSISNIEVIQSADPLLDAEALRVVRQSPPNWTPAVQYGKTVKVKYQFPFIFGTEDNSGRFTPYDTSNRELLFDGIAASEGFRNFVIQNLIYPSEAHERGITGVVELEFVIEKNGAIDNIMILNSADPLLIAEALRLVRISTPHWTPKKVNGEPISTTVRFPFSFRIAK